MSDGVRIGLVGLGAMGSPIAGALLGAGHELVVHDRDAGAVEAAVSLGAERAASARAVADAAAIVFVSLPTPAVVRDVACGAEGLVGGAAMEVYVDLSTTGAVVAGEVAEALSAAGVAVLDAPVSGGVAGARAHTLAVMAAGDPAVFARIRPLLELFGRSVFHVGAVPGQGQTVKLLNNLLSATAMAVTSEALTFAVGAGLDPATVLEVFNAGSGQNTATSQKFPAHVLTRRFASGFRLELMAKDVELCLAEARGERFPMLLGGLVQQLWTLARAQSEPTADHTEVVRLFERWAGVEVSASGA
ncbi:MAG TPA: NAD(P)-dependent oxidoreductase [Gaiellales bacterium]|jgi:2-hydroxy-3-oxopropionate reductase